MINVSIKKGFKRTIEVDYALGATYSGKVYPEIIGALPPNVQIIIEQPFLDGQIALKFTIYVGSSADTGVFAFSLSGTPKPDRDILFTLSIVEAI